LLRFSISLIGYFRSFLDLPIKEIVELDLVLPREPPDWLLEVKTIALGMFAGP
jgi:hypothetical protein